MQDYIYIFLLRVKIKSKIFDIAIQAVYDIKTCRDGQIPSLGELPLLVGILPSQGVIRQLLMCV